jgi:hypothetical protein
MFIYIKNFHYYFAFGVEHDLHHKDHLVAGGHHTDTNTTEIKYSSAVSLHSMRFAIAASELNVLFLIVEYIFLDNLEALTL